MKTRTEHIINRNRAHEFMNRIIRFFISLCHKHYCILESDRTCCFCLECFLQWWRSSLLCGVSVSFNEGARSSLLCGVSVSFNEGAPDHLGLVLGLQMVCLWAVLGFSWCLTPKCGILQGHITIVCAYFPLSFSLTHACTHSLSHTLTHSLMHTHLLSLSHTLPVEGKHSPGK